METALTSGLLTSLPGRYAKALFDLAEADGQIEAVGASLQALETLIRSSKILKQALADPTLQRQEQAAALIEICASMKAPEIVQSFAGQLVKSQRIPYLSKIEKIYQTLVSQAKGEQRIEVISAYRLRASQVELLKDKLKKVFPGTLTLTFANDSSILGGIMVRIGSRVIDATLVTQLSQLATVMKGNG
jgi:F-type H+-transporting ATPase subunit delta